MPEEYASTLVVERTFLNSTDTKETINVHKFETTPAQVGVNLKRTINLAQFNLAYESATVGINISIPCYKEEVLSVYKEVSKTARKVLEYEVNKLKTKFKGEY